MSRLGSNKVKVGVLPGRKNFVFKQNSRKAFKSPLPTLSFESCSSNIDAVVETRASFVCWSL